MKRITRYLAIVAVFFAGCSVAFTGVDPTRPASYEAPGEGVDSGPLTVSAIFSFSGYKVGIINGESLKVGEKINEFTIIAITPYTVELSGPDNKKLILPLVTPVMQAVY